MECALKITQMELHLQTDDDMILHNENGITGGITRTICHYAEANNKYWLSTYIQYLDFNNQYGSNFSQPLPYDRFDYV